MSNVLLLCHVHIMREPPREKMARFQVRGPMSQSIVSCVLRPERSKDLLDLLDLRKAQVRQKRDGSR